MERAEEGGAIEFEQFTKEFSKRVLDSIKKSAENYATDAVENTTERLAPMRDHSRGYYERFLERWGRALDLFEVCREVALMTGNLLNSEHRPKAAAMKDMQFDVVIRLQARVCLLAQEVEVLLRSGLPSGALARWRTMHEVGVVLQFIAKYPTSAELYVLHEHIEAKKASEGYNKVYAGTGKEIPPGDMRKFQENADSLVIKHGKAFRKEYGWAMIALGITDDRRKFGFDDIEQAVQLEILRPDYKMASHAIHANPKGVFFDLGSSLSRRRSIMMAGPSNAGIADPAWRAINTLVLATATLVTLRPSFQSATHSQALLLLGKEARDEFTKAHQLLREDEARVQLERNSESD